MKDRNPADSNAAWNERPGARPVPDEGDLDHWEMFAQAMDLTIEGHRLIAEEILYEMKLLWRGALSWLRAISVVKARRV